MVPIAPRQRWWGWLIAIVGLVLLAVIAVASLLPATLVAEKEDPQTGAVESRAGSLHDVVAELLAERSSERQGRLLDHDQAASMERKKREGYF